jgi:CDK inhibitor PHO81
LLGAHQPGDAGPATPSDVLVNPGTLPPHPNSAAPSPGGILREGLDTLTALAVLGGQDDDRGPDFQAHKAAFFFKLDRELEKVNAQHMLLVIFA